MKRFVVMSCILVCVGCPEEEKTRPEILRTVRYVVLKNEAAAKKQTFSGAVRAGNQSRLSFQVQGRVQSVSVKVGNRVKKGQQLAAIDPTDLKIQLQEARAGAAQARAQARSATATYERTRKLYTSQNASRQELDSARSQRDGAQSAAAAATQAVRRLVRQLEYAVLRAPGEGTVSEISIEAGEMVSAGSVVGMLQVGDELEVGVEVPASFINEISVGDDVTVQVDSNKGTQLSGSVFEVGVAALGGTMFPVAVRLKGPTEGVRAGMAADVVFERKANSDAEPGFAVPPSAVGEDREGRFVFVIENVSEGQGTVRRKSVEVGEIDSDGIKLKSGVESGMSIVTAGVARIRDGLRVLVPAKTKGVTP